MLRHYYRGGFIGKFNKDLFLGIRFNRSRPAQELKLLSEIAELGVPAPAPLAAHLHRVAPFTYRANLIMERIEDAEDVFHILKKRKLTASEWRSVGETIAEFHNKGVCHGDLNIHNILLDANGKCWITDMDKGTVIKPAQSWQQRNLSRLLRSLNKEKNLHDDFQWQEEDWDILLAGYQEAAPAPDSKKPAG